MALIAMQVRTISEIAAMAPTPEKAREILFHFEETVLADLDKLTISLLPSESPERLDQIRANAKEVVTSLLAATKFH
jgi:hypothetical protein